MLTLKAIHIAKPHKSTHMPKLVNKYVFTNAQKYKQNKKAQGITSPILHVASNCK